MSLAPPRPVAARPLARPGLLALLLTAAVLLLPFRLAGAWGGRGYPDVGVLRAAVGDGLVGSWAAGGPPLDARLVEAADFWARFHAVKAALALVLLAAAVVLARRAGQRALTAPSRARRWGAGVGATGAVGLAGLALLVVVANVQGALAPLSSVLGLLPTGAATGPLAETLEAMRRGVLGGSDGATTLVLLEDFRAYHRVMAVLGALVVVGLLALGVRMLRTRRRVERTDRGRRRLLLAGTVVIACAATFFAVVTAANAGTAAHPEQAFVGFLEGGS